jgi:hypothetical protein
MALIVQTFDGSTWSTFDQTANGFCRPVVNVSYSSPATFTFRLHAAQHTSPIPLRRLIALEDDTYSGHPNAPIFLGHVWEIVPQESNVLDYVCYGVDMRARNEITILSGPHGDPDVIPRLVYNAKIDNDDDYVFEAAHDATVGEIVEDILTNAYNELLTNCHAAPLTGGSDAFNTSDLTPFDFKPQEKIVFESEQIGQGIDRLLQYYPAYRVLFEPGYTSTLNRWRFINQLTASQVTLTLNRFGVSDKHVLSMSLKRNIQQRYTAVKIYGPQELTYTQVESGSGLTDLWDSGEAINFQAGGPIASGIGDAGKKWQITDSTKRKISRLMPDWVLLDDSQFSVNGQSYLQRRAKTPILQATWDGGDTWWTVQGATIDFQQGIIETPFAVFKYQPNDTPAYALPDSFRFAYAYFDDPVYVRAPSSGYEGTAYSVAGMSLEMRLYDEMLAVGYENGTPLLLATRTAQYEKLAQALLDSKKDIVWTGGCTIAGIDYDFLRLQKRINFAAVDGHGATLTTGWESINAILTDVEYDYEQKLTTLTFSSDMADYLGDSIDELKQKLKIRATRIEELTETTYTFGRSIGVFNNVRKFIVSEGDTGEEEVIGEI